MTGALLALAFIAFGALVLAAGLAWSGRARAVVRRWWLPWVAALVALSVLTAVFDTLMIAASLFDYGDAQILGLRIGLAPIEDFAYPLVALLVVPGVWLLASPRARRAPRPPRAPHDAWAAG